MIYVGDAALYTPSELLPTASFVIDGGVLQQLQAGALPMPPGDVTVIQARGRMIVPGMIDLQLNGAFGYDFTANPEAIWRVAAGLPRFGITAFLPTLVTCPLEQVAKAQQALRERPANFQGAEPLGLHVEGPFLNEEKKGAHNPAYLLPPDSELVTNWSRENGVRLVTIAPELPNALGLVEDLATRGVVVSMGHTMATLEQAEAGYSAGIRYATHLFNAMPPLDHRSPNAPGAVLAHKEWVTGLIPDGIHVHPAMVKLVWDAKGKNINLVSDAMAALGMPPGRYKLNDFDCVVSDKDARLHNGTLAGSVLALNDAVRNFIAYTGCSVSDALEMVTTTPARLLGIENERGRIAPGLAGDFVMLDDDWNVLLTAVRGEVVYRARGV